MKLTDPEMIAAVTRHWEGERDGHGRPLVPDEVLARLHNVTTEDAWTIMNKEGYERQFAGNWINLHPDRILVGRAITCRWVPLRPDLHDALLEIGEKEDRIGFLNSWVIDEMVDGDVLVADLWGKVNLVGDNLTAAIVANGGRGMVIEGGLRDLQRIVKFDDFCTFVKRIHPEAIPGVTMPEINGITRIDTATCLPGDVVHGTPTGILFIPPHLAGPIADEAEFGLE
jgi:regulator of RNase E activity RraA